MVLLMMYGEGHASEASTLLMMSYIQDKVLLYLHRCHIYDPLFFSPVWVTLFLRFLFLAVRRNLMWAPQGLMCCEMLFRSLRLNRVIIWVTINYLSELTRLIILLWSLSSHRMCENPRFQSSTTIPWSSWSVSAWVYALCHCCCNVIGWLDDCRCS